MRRVTIKLMLLEVVDVAAATAATLKQISAVAVAVTVTATQFLLLSVSRTQTIIAQEATQAMSVATSVLLELRNLIPS